MTRTLYDDNAGGGDKKWSTTSSWDTSSVPTSSDDAYLTDVRTSNAMIGENIQTGSWPANIYISKYSGNIGTSGTHWALDDAVGSETLNSLHLENATGKIYMDFEEAAGNNIVTDTHINIPGQAADQCNLGGAAAFTNIHCLRGRVNLGMTGVISDLWVAHSTTPKDVYCNIDTAATTTNVRQGGGFIMGASTNGVTLWMQDGGSTQLTGSGTIVDYYLRGGNLRIDGSGTLLTITNLYIKSGMVNLTQAGNIRTLVNIYIWPGGTLDLRGVETLVNNTKIVAYGNATVLGNKQPTLSFP